MVHLGKSTVDALKHEKKYFAELHMQGNSSFSFLLKVLSLFLIEHVSIFYMGGSVAVRAKGDSADNVQSPSLFLFSVTGDLEQIDLCINMCSSPFSFKLILLKIWCYCVYACTCVWRSEDNCLKWVLSFQLYMSSEDW